MRWRDSTGKEDTVADIDVIVVTYQSAAQLRPCLATVGGSPQIERLVVVDNASRDGSAAVARQAGADVVRENDRNLGFARAVNIGLRDAGADFVLLLNPDAMLTPASLDRLKSTLEQEPGAAVVGPLLRRGGRVTAGAGSFGTVVRRVGLCVPLIGRAPFFRPEYVLPADPPDAGRPVDVDYLFGAAMLLDRAFLTSVGGLDERFFLFAEDEDVCRQARAACRRVLLEGRAMADHIGGASYTDDAATEAQRLFSQHQLFHKWQGPAAAAAFHRGILAAFGLREAAARSRALVNSRPLPSTPAGLPVGRVDVTTLRRTARLFDSAVRSGRHPLSFTSVDATRDDASAGISP